MGIRIGGGVGPVRASVGTGGCLEALGALILIGFVVYVGLIALAIALTVVPIFLAIACAVFEFRRGDDVNYVGDVKYKLTSSGQARTSDYYQLLAYCTVLGLGEGILIYAQTDDADPHDEIVVQNAKTRLITYRLDLSGTPADIEASIERLATRIADAAILRRAA